MLRTTFVLLLVAAMAAVVVEQGSTARDPAPLVATLTGETLTDPTTTGTKECRLGALDFTMTYSVAGNAAGPYPGTFEEEGSFIRNPSAPDQFEATFRIVSGDTIITGQKFGGGASGASCFDSPTIPNCCAGFFVPTARYEATIQTPEGTFTDRGTTAVSATTTAPFTETFVSDFGEFFCEKLKEHKDPTKTKCKD